MNERKPLPTAREGGVRASPELEPRHGWGRGRRMPRAVPLGPLWSAAAFPSPRRVPWYGHGRMGRVGRRQRAKERRGDGVMGRRAKGEGAKRLGLAEGLEVEGSQIWEISK